MALFRQLEEGAGQIALKQDFGDPNLVDTVVKTINDLFGVDLSAFFDTVNNLVELGITTLKSIVQDIVDIFSGVVGAVVNPICQAIKDWFGLITGFRENTIPELAGLQSTTQKLEGIIGYAHGYANGGWSSDIGLAKRNAVDGIIGPTLGVTRQTGSYYLSSKGLWVADARINIDQAGIGVAGTTELQVRVYAPNGALHAVATSLENTDRRHCHVIHLPFTVPTAGYYVEMWTDVPGLRNAWGGSHFNGFSVEKRSMETS
ncbi:hypothetical protein SEA_MACGULLY_56 [Rhodococcus phage MacGully]|nr:hypothetical protein SEA_MACGULLY_56 [Rhodococcus phage MacGully]